MVERSVGVRKRRTRVGEPRRLWLTGRVVRTLPGVLIARFIG
jgi:hypothetical protein